MANLTDFLNFLRSKYDYGTDEKASFKAEFIDRMEVLLSKYELSSMHFQQLTALTNTLKAAIKSNFAFKQNIVANGEVDLSKACVYDFCFAYALTFRSFFENQLSLKPVPDVETNRLNFFADSGNGENVFYLDLPVNFLTNPFLGKMNFVYDATNNRIIFYIFTAPVDDSDGTSKTKFNNTAMAMPYASDLQANIFANARVMMVNVLRNNKALLADFLNETPKAKRAVNRLRYAVGLSEIPLYNISIVFVNGLIEVFEQVIADSGLLASFHEQLQLPPGIPYVIGNPNVNMLNYLNRYVPSYISCDWGKSYPYLCRVSGGTATDVNEPVFLFDGTTLLPLDR